MYTGEYAAGQQTGRGLLSYASGDRYEGGLKSGTPYDTGVYTYAGGGYYTGQYLATTPGIGKRICDE